MSKVAIDPVSRFLIKQQPFVFELINLVFRFRVKQDNLFSTSNTRRILP